MFPGVLSEYGCYCADIKNKTFRLLKEIEKDKYIERYFVFTD